MTFHTGDIAMPEGVSALPQSPDLVRLIQTCREIQARPPRQTWADIPFADGVYRFHLGRDQIKELERLCGHQDREGAVVPIGIGALFARVSKGRAFLTPSAPDWSNIHEAAALASEITERDCIETMRLALVGGNHAVVNGEAVAVSPMRVKQLMETYVVYQPLEDAWLYAFAALGARIVGVEAAPASVAAQAI